jgi:hypothetical protein
VRRPVALLATLVAAAAHADEPSPTSIVVMPGAARAISHGLSASRDTALLGLAFTPYSVLTAGADLGLVELQLASATVRFGFFGLIELESDRPFSGHPADFIPRENSAFWRAQGGYSVALALDGLAHRVLGERGALEATLSLRHESEHFTGSTGGDAPKYEDYPHIGNFLMADVAVRLPAGNLDVELRVQCKWFPGGDQSYTVGPGVDAIVRWHLLPRLEPFSSTFAEYLVGADRVWPDGRRGVPDDRLVRNLTGVILPGRFGDVQIFNSIELGDGKGLNVYKNELRWGGGVRLAF